MKRCENKFFGKIIPLFMGMLFVVNATYAETIENKSDKFGNILSNDTSTFDSSKNELAEQIRKQRAAIEARESANTFNAKQQQALTTGRNGCDAGLRKCMQGVCGSDYLKCILDGDTIMGDKFNKCRRDLECTGEEFRLFTTEIKADMEMNSKLSSYNKIIDCGNDYNKCLVAQCGATFGKCLGKPNADKAIRECETVAKRCVEQDSGLAARFGTVIGRLRENAEIEIKKDEERMYKLRDTMREQCRILGAMFDERTFDCVFTVQFFTGANKEIPMATRKRYAGDTFVCMQEWFGVDTTTYKENAYRETRAQTGASSAMLGSGVGTAVGAITSGAIGRAIDSKKALNKLKDAKKEIKTELKEDLKDVKEMSADANGVVQNGSAMVNTVMDDTGRVTAAVATSGASEAVRGVGNSIMSDQRSAIQRASDNVMGTRTLTPPTSGTPSSTPTKLSRPDPTSSVGFKSSGIKAGK